MVGGSQGQVEYVCLYIYIYGQIITTSLRPSPGILGSKGNHPRMALVQVSEIF